MPVMEPNLDAATLKTWAQGIDDGPFSSLCWGSGSRSTIASV